MFGYKCTLFFFVLAWNRVNSWDVAITTNNGVEFYNKGYNVKTLHGTFENLGDIALDAFNERIFFVDNFFDSSTIYSFDLISNRNATVIAKTPGFIPSIAYDPVTNTLFWTNTKVKGVYWKNVDESNKGEMPSMFVNHFRDNQFPVAIAVEFCRGYVYWSSWDIDRQTSTIQKARIDGTNIQTILDNDLEFPNSLVVDERKSMLYWIDTSIDEHYSIRRSDLEGRSRVTLLNGYKNVPIDLAVSKHSLFWNNQWNRHIWNLKKTADNSLPSIYNEINGGVSIVANYKINEQVDDFIECTELRSLKDNTKEKEKKVNQNTCEGKACQLEACQKDCLSGDCIESEDGTPLCVCNPGIAGGQCNLKILFNNTVRERLNIVYYFIVICSIIAFS